MKKLSEKEKFADKVKRWFEWARTHLTPAAWVEIFEAGKALVNFIYTFGYFFVYPFIESCKAFYKDVILPFWGHCKDGWFGLVEKAKSLWKEVKDVFGKNEKPPEQPPQW